MNGQNPFSLETIRARKEERFPAIPVDPFTKREKKIVAQGREEVLAIGLTGLKGRYAMRESVHLELVAHKSFFGAAAEIEQRMHQFQETCQDQEFAMLGTIFAYEGVKRMGGAIASMADAAETNMKEIVEHPYDLDDEQQGWIQRLFSGR